jgi:antibiotic biosynthesis monooxygenase (ABM) superfamily enzyme
MYGTVMRAHVRPENRERFVELMTRYEDLDVPGYRSAHLMFPENRENEVLMAVWFEDQASYRKNAEDPTQHERFLEYRALLEDEPEWSDGEWIEAPSGKE